MFDFKSKLLAKVPDAYIKEIDISNIGGLGSGAPRVSFEVRRPTKILWLFNTYICLGKHIIAQEAWREAYNNTIIQ